MSWHRRRRSDIIVDRNWENYILYIIICMHYAAELSVDYIILYLYIIIWYYVLITHLHNILYENIIMNYGVFAVWTTHVRKNCKIKFYYPRTYNIMTNNSINALYFVYRWVMTLRCEMKRIIFSFETCVSILIIL